MKPEIRIIGVGNDFRGDDAVGLQVARSIREMDLPQVAVLETGGEAGRLMELWQDPTPVILIDAMHSGVPPGTIYRFAAGVEPIPAGYFPSTSTHSLGVVESIELARVLRQLPSRLVVYGIEGESFEAGAPLSPKVARAAEEVVRRVLKELKDWVNLVFPSD